MERVPTVRPPWSGPNTRLTVQEAPAASVLSLQLSLLILNRDPLGRESVPNVCGSVPSFNIDTVAAALVAPTAVDGNDNGFGVEDKL